MPLRPSHRILALALIALAALLVAPSTASAISREQVLARGKVWVDRFVPYSQSAYADAAGNRVASSSLGWRTDCSGFASYCLGLTYSDGRPLSYDSASILKVLYPITKDDLRPGDIIDRPKGAPYSYGHSVVFVGWADEAETLYWSYEESSGRGGAVTRLVEYPYWGEPGFAPYRYKGIEEAFEPWVEPISGASRYETAVRASQTSFATGSVDTAIVCSGLTWPDALGGAALAGAVGGPVLLTKPDEVPTCVSAELARLGATRVIVIGGEGVVSTDVASALVSGTVSTVQRVGGEDRYDTAAQVASMTVAEVAAAGGAMDGTVYLASGEQFPDALAASPMAACFRRPILLTRAGKLPTATAEALAAIGPARVVVLGGDGAVGAAVASAACQGRLALRISGADRYATAAKIAEHGVGEGMWWAGVGIATGESFPDALAGGVAQGATGAPMLLTRGTALSAATRSALDAHSAEIVRARCFGGTSVVTCSVREEIARCLGMTD